MRLRSNRILASPRNNQARGRGGGRGRGRGQPRQRRIVNRRVRVEQEEEEEEEEKPIYCGNNRLHPSVYTEQEDGETTHRLGTPKKCMEKGFFHGSRQPIDPSYAGRYEPLYNRRIWCGENPLTDEELNNRNIDMNGSLVECYRKGFGGGKSRKAQQRVRGRGRGRGRGRRGG